MLKPLEILEDKLATLLEYTRELQLSNRQLREQVKTLQEHNTQLEERMGIAQTRIDHVIDQLQASMSAAPTDGSDDSNNSGAPTEAV